MLALAAGQGEWRDGRLRYGGFDVRCIDLTQRLGLRIESKSWPPAERPAELLTSGAETLAVQADAVRDARELLAA